MDENHHEQPATSASDQGEMFVQLLLEHEPAVRAFLRGLLPTWDDVDDVLQEAGLIAWRKFKDFQPGTAFGGWFLTIARYEALAHRRRITHTPLVFSEDLWDLLADEANEPDDSPGYRQHLEVCLAKLQPKKRELLLKVHAPGVVIRDVALQSGKSEQAFYKIIQRMRAVVLQCVAKSLAAENA